ncbi:MAG: exopolyphosphatase [Alphaproteobacteria bacterium]|nr:exopolyphosphatase [Alphaproteobacteria bacterium]
MSDGKFRLVTRSDFDGLVCAVILKELDLIDDIKFVHPKDMQDGTVVISGNDITTNLPYVNGVGLAFDHHHSEVIRLGEKKDNHIIDPDAPSAARVVFDYYGGEEKLPRVSNALMEAVDKGDSAQFTEDEILNPQGWVLLNFLMDSRTGLGRFREFRISNYHLMMELIDYCRDHGIEDILKMPDVVERVDLFTEHGTKAAAQIQRCTTVHKNFAVLDLRDEEPIFAANRFLIYALFPETNISAHVMWGLNKQNTVFAVGKSILNRTSNTNIGELMLSYGGGGHENAGTCQVANDQTEVVRSELIAKITADG